METLDLTQFITEEIAKMISVENSLPEAGDVCDWILRKERIIYLETDVDPQVTAIQKQILAWNKEDEGKPVEERKPIKVYIMSYGGDADCAWMLIDTLLASKTPVYTVDVGVASSAAGIIFMAGHKRFMFKNAHVLIHEGSAQFTGDSTKVMDMTDAYKKMLKRMKEFILERTEIPARELNKKRANDWELDAEMCIKYNVAHTIVDSLEEVL